MAQIQDENPACPACRTPWSLRMHLIAAVLSSQACDCCSGLNPAPAPGRRPQVRMACEACGETFPVMMAVEA